MAEYLCPNITSNQSNYSSPLPFIGLYIAAATMVCFILMLCDVIHGLRIRKTWLPCQFFALNSVTLTLLSIAAKLPVDLTTAMPSALDQLSKLTGTTLICVSMIFIMPSLGSNGTSECFTNMTAMTILVVTVVVNVCIQMSTGVIFSFILEHVIIMSCMFAMLLILWSANWGINIHREIQRDFSKDLFTIGGGAMLGRLKLCYLHGYNYEPQFIICKNNIITLGNVPCVFCLIVVLQATFRSHIIHELLVSNRVSDYGWSIKIIIVTQILVILLANFALARRWHVNYRDNDYFDFCGGHKTFEIIRSNAPFLKGDTRDYLNDLLRNAVVIGHRIILIFQKPLCCVIRLVYKVAVKTIDTWRDFTLENTEFEGIQEYRYILREKGMVLGDWTLRKCVQDIKRWMSVCKRNNSFSDLGKLLSERPPSQESVEELNRQFGFKEGNEASCLYLVFLVRIASVSAPSTLSGRLMRSLREVFEVIYFADTVMNSSRPNNKKKRMLAKAMWKGNDLNIALSKGSQSALDHAFEIIKEFKNKLPSTVWDEVGIIMDWIIGREYTSVEELYDYMEQLFVDMLHIFLIQLPHAIFKQLMDSTSEEYEETARRMLKLLWQVEHLEDKVQWSFPVGSNITSLITSQASVTNHHMKSTVVDDVSDLVASHVMDVEYHKTLNVYLHEVIQVE